MRLRDNVKYALALFMVINFFLASSNLLGWSARQLALALVFQEHISVTIDKSRNEGSSLSVQLKFFLQEELKYKLDFRYI